jgi:predicted membrane-bound dolichyl-phosphate-mannose-protein mannosyltransferase
VAGFALLSGLTRLVSCYLDRQQPDADSHYAARWVISSQTGAPHVCQARAFISAVLMPTKSYFPTDFTLISLCASSNHAHLATHAITWRVSGCMPRSPSSCHLSWHAKYSPVCLRYSTQIDLASPLSRSFCCMISVRVSDLPADSGR